MSDHILEQIQGQHDHSLAVVLQLAGEQLADALQAVVIIIIIIIIIVVVSIIIISSIIISTIIIVIIII